MKKYILSFLAVSAMAVSACGDFLDVKSEGTPAIDNYFSNDQQAIDAVDALYGRMAQENYFGREIFWEQGAATDVVWGRTRGYPTLATLDYTGDESPLRDVFNQSYIQISRCNLVVDKLLAKKASITLTEVESRSLGEAYFLRAFYHFYIAYRYGTKDQGVPFERYEDFADGYNYSIPKQQPSVVDNYKMIISDLTEAETLLPEFSEYGTADRGRAHKAAAVAYMAKVYAYWATWDSTQWDNVITCVNKLETSYGRDLASSIAKLFSSNLADFWNDEYCWSIPGAGGSNGGGSEFPGVILENKGWGIYNGWGQNKPSYDIFEEMNKDGAGNERVKQAILEYGQEFQFFGETRKFWSASDNEAGFAINKYMDAFKYDDPVAEGAVNADGNWPTTRCNFHLLRFADCLLLRAEAYLNTGKADKATIDINRVRTRSHLDELPGTATFADLYHERRCELAFEMSDHLYDLKRWAVSGEATIKALAIAELTVHPRVRHYTDRSDPESDFTVGPYEDYNTAKVWSDHKIVFPYPSEQIKKSAGALKQNANY